VGATRTIFVTGATGLVGSNLCQALIGRGHKVRALVRDATAAAPVIDPDVELLEGDVADADAVTRGAARADAVVHCAAILGGAAGRFDASAYEAINLGGTINVLDAAEERDCPAVVLSTIAALQTDTTPVSEISTIPDEIPGESPYTRSKRLALKETARRVDRGLHVCAVVPGGIYGASPSTARALAPTSFNYELQRALKGSVTRYASVRLPWSYTADVVDVILRALDRGEPGARYLAMAEPEEALTVAAFLTRACEIAGVEHMVKDVAPSDDPAFDQEFAGMARLARRRFPDPLYDNRRTVEHLGTRPTPIDRGLAATTTWLREIEGL
jgi:dihydroflavonol-4-reductase